MYCITCSTMCQDAGAYAPGRLQRPSLHVQLSLFHLSLAPQPLHPPPLLYITSSLAVNSARFMRLTGPVRGHVHVSIHLILGPKDGVHVSAMPGDTRVMEKIHEVYLERSVAAHFLHFTQLGFESGPRVSSLMLMIGRLARPCRFADFLII